MKYLLVAAVLGIVFTLVYLRLRPYINFARGVLGVVREARGVNAARPTPNAARQTAKPGERLVRCAVCGTWLPASRALALRSASSSYCSHACMERSAGEENRQRTAGLK
ncbi:MAG TPA: hypothetical protein VJT82_02760 [Pyrinomonadaceae bacterium]|nr:hypothetical protein [Pyrinomonadaceae bacterium]